MATSDFFLFPSLKRTLKGYFSTIDEIKEKSRAELKAIPKELFYQYFQTEAMLAQFIISQGNYFEVYTINSKDLIFFKKIRNSGEIFFVQTLYSVATQEVYFDGNGVQFK